MATPQKPAARRPAAKTTARKKAVLGPADKASKTEAPAPKQEPAALTQEQKQAKLEAYQIFQTAGLPIPDELKIVEEWIEERRAEVERERQQLDEERQRRQNELEQANQNGPWYVRNMYPAPFNLRLDRQTERRRLELKARGTPGDLHPIKEEDLNDPVLKQNMQIGLIEVIPAGEASLIIEKQTQNMGRREHTPLSVLRNETGKPYEQGQVKVEAEFNSQGVTVAQVQPGLLEGKLHDREVGGARAAGGINRVQPGQNLLPGQAEPPQATSVVTSGFVPTGGQPASVQYGMDQDAHARVIDDLARRKNVQGPAAGLGNVAVVIDPVQKT